jgi:hypothetical protein
MLDSLSVILAQSDIGSADIFLEASRAAGPGDGYHVLMPIEKPCECELRGRAALLFSYLRQARGNRKICFCSPP